MDDLSKNTYVEVLLPLPLPTNYTYQVGKGDTSEVTIGKRVIVQFGKNKIYTALIRNIHHQKPEAYLPKFIDSVIDEHPIVTELQFRLWEWIASYYMCTVGEVMAAALPAGYRLTSETRVVRNPAFGKDFSTLNKNEYLIAEALTYQDEMTLGEIQKLLERKQVYSFIRELLRQRVIFLYEDLKTKYKPKFEKYLVKGDLLKDEAHLQDIFEDLSRAPKQVDLLMHFIDQVRGKKRLKKSTFVKHTGATHAVLKSLVNKQILSEVSLEVSRLLEYDPASDSDFQLSEVQKEALSSIKDQFQDKDVVLLDGVTSSGKTLIYIELIKEVIAKGKQVLYLLPEIALTAQIITRLRKVFGSSAGIYHSKFNDNERVEIWQKVLKSEYKVVLGARSALFMPFADLGLIIVDEEHDGSFKQSDPAPRYQGRDTAVLLAKMAAAKVLLGTATPSLESYYNAAQGKYGLTQLKTRYGDVQMPEILPVNLKDQLKKKLMQSHFSGVLIDKMRHALALNEQIILFQNRRGFSPHIYCSVCGWIPQCRNCDVSLTYHKFIDSLVCHLCGYKKRNITSCQACGSHKMIVRGFGTEKIEDEIKLIFPKSIVARMDWDTAKTKYGHQKLIQRFENKEIDILVGTQMVTKGLDFDNVSLVGILNADQLLFYPDFRASERAFQLMSQVSGRAGRKQKRGTVVIQTYHPDHAIIRHVYNYDFPTFFNEEMQFREQFSYPPFTRLIKLTLKHRKFEIVESASSQLAGLLKPSLGNRLLGPTIPPVSKIKNLYLRDMLIKIEKKASVMEAIKRKVLSSIEKLNQNNDFKSVRVIIDVGL